MTDTEALKRQLERADQEIGYLKRRISRMEKRLLRQEKLDDMNRHQTKWAMQQLEEARALAEKANQAKTDFLANMSHEIRTPLNIVLGMGELLAGTELADSQKQYLQSLRLSGEHLLKLINDILEFSRIESGCIEAIERSFDLKELLVGVEAMGAHLALEKGIEFSLEYDSSFHINRLGDSRKLRQVLLNLVGNAVKYTDSGGVCLSVAGLEYDNRESVLFSVSDTGIGIAQDKQELIFERFTQLEQGSRKIRNGVGLGLAISQRLAEAMGGLIKIESEIGKGSSFTVQLRLPFSEEDSFNPRYRELVGLPDALGPLRILVVDDIYLNFEVIRNYLKDLPVTIKYAENGRRAHKAFVDDSCDIILMDLRMPVMGGIEAVNHIRKLEEKLDIGPTPIIAMTAHAFVEQEETYLESGFDEVLIKPFTRIDLLAVLKRHSKQLPANAELVGNSDDQHASVDDGSGALAALIPKVLDTIAEEIVDIKRALSDNDHAILEKTSHSAKGLAGFYGFTRLSDLLDHLEESASRREYRTARALIVAIGSHVDELRRRQESSFEDIAN